MKACFAAVHITAWDDARSEDFISLTELDEGQSIGVTKTSDSNALKNTVATQLIENEWDIDPTWGQCNARIVVE